MCSTGSAPTVHKRIKLADAPPRQWWTTQSEPAVIKKLASIDDKTPVRHSISPNASNKLDIRKNAPLAALPSADPKRPLTLAETGPRQWWLVAPPPTAPVVARPEHAAQSTVAQLRASLSHLRPSKPMASDALRLTNRSGKLVHISEATATASLRQPIPAQTATHSSLSVRQVRAAQNAAAKTRAVHATPGVPTSFVPRPSKPMRAVENAEEAWDRRQGNAMYLLVSGVADTSATTYCTGWKHWIEMCHEYNDMDPFLQIPPDIAGRSQMSVKIPFQITAVLHFIAYLAERGDNGTRKLKATTIVDYLAAVRHFLQINLVDVEFMTNPIITKVKSALACEERFDDLVQDTKNLAFTPDMILYFKHNLASTQSFQDQAIVMAMELQFTALNRVSELIPTAADYYCRAMDIKFGFDLQGLGKITTVTSHNSWAYPVSHVCSMTYRIRGSKTDQHRRGVTMYFEVMDESDPSVAFCVVRDALRWAQVARPTGEDAFLSYRNEWGLGYDQYNAAFKLTALRMDLPPERYSTHSARIGGASALASAGLPDWQIKKLGRWKSLAFLEYIQTALTSMRAAQVAMVNPLTFSVTDTKRLHHLA